MTDEAVPMTVSTHVAQDYETLRTAALGEDLAVPARSGLTLFLRRGMWGWAQATSNAGEFPRSTPPTCADASVGDNNKGVVQLLAAMAMSGSHRRAYERSS